MAFTHPLLTAMTTIETPSEQMNYSIRDFYIHDFLLLG